MTGLLVGAPFNGYDEATAIHLLYTAQYTYIGNVFRPYVRRRTGVLCVCDMVCFCVTGFGWYYGKRLYLL